ncbi:hypothetical protein Bbelb_096520 [Branchiostoma belcheri]|nr:hypothetical protein Bbelb_096520 [Branchiostoma belcheri]
MPRQKALPREVSMQGEDPAYVTPNDARGEPVYVNPSGDLADAENVIYERAGDASEDDPEYLTLRNDTADKAKGDQPRYTTLKVDASEGMKTAREGGEGSEQPPVETDVLAAGDSGILKRLYQRMTGHQLVLCIKIYSPVLRSLNSQYERLMYALRHKEDWSAARRAFFRRRLALRLTRR